MRRPLSCTRLPSGVSLPIPCPYLQIKIQQFGKDPAPVGISRAHERQGRPVRLRSRITVERPESLRVRRQRQIPVVGAPRRASSSSMSCPGYEKNDRSARPTPKITQIAVVFHKPEGGRDAQRAEAAKRIPVQRGLGQGQHQVGTPAFARKVTYSPTKWIMARPTASLRRAGAGERRSTSWHSARWAISATTTSWPRLSSAWSAWRAIGSDPPKIGVTTRFCGRSRPPVPSFSVSDQTAHPRQGGPVPKGRGRMGDQPPGRVRTFRPVPVPVQDSDALRQGDQSADERRPKGRRVRLVHYHPREYFSRGLHMVSGPDPKKNGTARHGSMSEADARSGFRTRPPGRAWNEG
jgi:hypothetical protein